MIRFTASIPVSMTQSFGVQIGSHRRNYMQTLGTVQTFHKIFIIWRTASFFFVETKENTEGRVATMDKLWFNEALDPSASPYSDKLRLEMNA